MKIRYSLLDDVALEKEKKSRWYPEFDVVLEDEEQSGSLLDGIVVSTCENKLGWLRVDVLESHNVKKLWGLANDFGGSAGRNILCWPHDTTVVLKDKDKHEWMTGNSVLLNDLKLLG